MKRSFRGWPSSKRKRRIVCRPLAPQMPLRHIVCLSLLQKREPQSSWMGESITSILTSSGHQGDPPTDQSPEAESGIKPTLLNDTDKTASLPSKGPYSTSALPTNTNPGISAAANPTMWLLSSNSLPAYSRSCRGGPQSTSRLYAHQTCSNPGDLQCKFQPHCKG